MTRGQNGALLLSCAALSSATPCRFNPGAFLDHLVRSHQHIRRDRQADLLGGLHMDHKLELCRLLDWNVGWLRALENLVDHSRDASIHKDVVWSIGHKSTSFDELPICVHGWKAVLYRKLCDPCVMNSSNRGPIYEDCLSTRLARG